MSTAPQLPWIERPTFEIDAAVPAAERLRDVPPSIRAQAKRLLAAVMSEIPAAARGLADAVRVRTAGRFQAEARLLAGETESDWRTIVLANVSYDLAMATFGCSTVALATADGPVLARNMDWWPEDLLARASCQLRYVNAGRLKWVNLGWPGAIGSVTGMSSRGFALALNAVCGPEGVDKSGYPMLLHIRRVLEDADGFDDAVARLSKARVASPGLVTVVGTENDQRVVIERSPTRHALRRPEGDQPLVTTNDYRLLFTAEDRVRGSGEPGESGESELTRTACARFDGLTECLADHDPAADAPDAMLLYALTAPSVIQEITAQHAIMRPRAATSRLFVPRRLLEAA